MPPTLPDPLLRHPNPHPCGLLVSPDGRVQTPQNSFPPEYPDASGYLRVSWKRRPWYVHRLVLEVYRGECPHGCEARHLDGNKANNRLENLQWGTRQQQAADREAHGTQPRGEKTGTAKLEAYDVFLIRLLFDRFSSYTIGKLFGISHNQVRLIATGRKWKHLSQLQKPPRQRAPCA